MAAIRSVFLAMLALGLGLAGGGPASAQAYPSKSIHIVVTAPAGGITDTLARALAQKLTETWGQQVIVENKPAGAGHIGMDTVAKSTPDGYTLVVTPDSSFVVNPHLYTKLSYDPVHDFIPVTGLGISPQAVLVHPAVPANTFAELVELGKKKPGELNYGTFGIGTSGHLNIILLENLTGAKFTPVHYRGAAPAITDLLGGHIQMMTVAIGLISRIGRPARSRCLASARVRACRNIPMCRPSPKACRISRRAPGTASPRPKARRARSSTSSAPRRKKSSATRPSATNSWPRP
jgi:tripartite-type tricarboxylate transporter receptor subunit TctC